MHTNALGTLHILSKARKLEKVIEFDYILQEVKKYDVQKNSSVHIFIYKLKNVLYKLRNA